MTTMDNIGIYCIFFEDVDNKYYIGCSTNLKRRISDHLASLLLNEHSNKKLQNTYNKYGKIVVEIIEICSVDVLFDRETYWINQFDSFHHGFNQTTGGEGAGIGENNSSAYHNEELYKLILTELAYTSKPYSQIAKELDSTQGVIKNIARLETHGYLKELMPVEYNIITNKLNTRDISAKYRGIEYPTIMDPLGNEYKVDNIHKFAEEHELQYQNLHKVLTGKRKKHLGWHLK